MKYRKFHADYLFDGYHLLQDKVLVTDAEGTVQDIVASSEAGSDIQILPGVLCPGLINCHCHLELSHLKDVIPPHTGLIDFLVSVVQKRGFEIAIIQEAIKNAEQEMYNNGIVAVGDVCNTTDAVNIKSISPIRWHSFIEVLSFTDEGAIDRLNHYKAILRQHEQNVKLGHRNVLTAHSPYTISPDTFRLINQATENQIISIHNQENPAEDELYRTGNSDLLRLFKIFGFDQSPFPITGKTSLQSYLPYFNKGQTILLVHNTYTSEEDILFAREYASTVNLNLVYCLCVNANKYIENTSPPVELFIKNNCLLVLGTDSYSSNWQLNLAKEINTVLKTSYFQDLPYFKAFETVLKWATINGARALKVDDQFGSFVKGKQPGVVLIEGLEQKNLNARRIL
jgi:cytosine/adenosine deaminase-related metal-dependent hydrolase